MVHVNPDLGRSLIIVLVFDVPQNIPLQLSLAGLLPLPGRLEFYFLLLLLWHILVPQGAGPVLHASHHLDVLRSRNLLEYGIT